MADKVTVRVTGLAELRKALKQVVPELDKQLAAKLLGVAKVIIPQAQSLMPHVSGHAAGTLHARVITRGAQIQAGSGDANDYVPWLIFGGRVGRQASIVRERVVGGRYIMPAINAARPATLAAIDAAMAEAALKAGFETSGKLDAT